MTTNSSTHGTPRSRFPMRTAATSAVLLAAVLSTGTPAAAQPAPAVPREIYTCHYRAPADHAGVCIGTDHGRAVQFTAHIGDIPRLRRTHQVYWASQLLGYQPCGQAIGMLRAHIETALWDMEKALADGHRTGAPTSNASQALITSEARSLTTACQGAMPARGQALADAAAAIAAARTATPRQLATPVRTVRLALRFPAEGLHSSERRLS